MKKNGAKGFLFVSLLLFFGVSVKAQVYLYPDSVMQGSTVKIEVVKGDVSNIEGTLEGEKIRFFASKRPPNKNEEITRVEFLKLILDNNSFSNDEKLLVAAEDGSDFSDVAETDENSIYVRKAVALGWANGYSNGNFGPYDAITRAQAAKILINAFGESVPVESDDKVKSETNNFPDLASNHDLYDYLLKAVSAGYFRGYPDGLLRPDRFITIAEADIVVKRASSIEDEEYKSLQIRKYLVGYVGVHRLWNSGQYQIHLKMDGVGAFLNEVDLPLKVTFRNVPISRYTLPATKTALFDAKYRDETWKKIDNAKKTVSADKIWDGIFDVPTEGTITQGYGEKVYVNGAYSGSHFGIDYANKAGTDIRAANKGRVVLAGETPQYGWTVLIDHGLNVYSMYIHMNGVDVTEGQIVGKGDVLGPMGSTGISTGPHLHFTMFVGNIVVDPNEWLSGLFL